MTNVYSLVDLVTILSNIFLWIVKMSLYILKVNNSLIIEFIAASIR